VVIEAQEDTESPVEPLTEDVPEDGPGVLRVRITAAAARAFSQRAIQVVGQGRPPCPLCGLPLAPTVTSARGRTATGPAMPDRPASRRGGRGQRARPEPPPPLRRGR
jgi:hypothetical protein